MVSQHKQYLVHTSVKDPGPSTPSTGEGKGKIRHPVRQAKKTTANTRIEVELRPDDSLAKGPVP